MKLYNANLSNFASRCRLAIYEKNANVEIAPIPGGDLKSPEYLKLYPLGKTPAFEMENGEVIGESEVIDEYLEEKFPTPSLFPKGAEARAKVRYVSRFHDLYLEPPIRALFPQVGAKEKDQTLITAKLEEIDERFDQLEKLVAGKNGFVADEFTFADCTLIPTMFFATLLLPMLGGKNPVETRSKLGAWWQTMQTRPNVKKVLSEQQEALAERMKGT